MENEASATDYHGALLQTIVVVFSLLLGAPSLSTRSILTTSNKPQRSRSTSIFVHAFPASHGLAST